MICYICETSARPSGSRYGIRPAVGVCHHCGIGVCVEHSYRAKEFGAPLLCKECAELAQSVEWHVSQPSPLDCPMPPVALK